MYSPFTIIHAPMQSPIKPKVLWAFFSCSKIVTTYFSKGESNRGSSPIRLQRDFTCNKISINLSRCYIERLTNIHQKSIEDE